MDLLSVFQRWWRLITFDNKRGSFIILWRYRRCQNWYAIADELWSTRIDPSGFFKSTGQNITDRRSVDRRPADFPYALTRNVQIQWPTNMDQYLGTFREEIQSYNGPYAILQFSAPPQITQTISRVLDGSRGCDRSRGRWLKIRRLIRRSGRVYNTYARFVLEKSFRARKRVLITRGQCFTITIYIHIYI